MKECTIETELVGDSLVMRQLRALITRVAPSGLPVLVQGETGVGKELVARAVHRASGRSGPLVAVNVCAIGDAMFEDALFGHVRGAFTGAVQGTAGYLMEAHRGTLFLDEVSGLSLANQAKLLRAIETRQFRPVGAPADRQSDFRVLAASNEDLAALVGAGRFRRDLLHRLGGVRLTVPPLRERRSDIPLLVAAFAARLGTATARATSIDGGAMDALQRHGWPGNVRELRHVVEAALTLAADEAVGCADLAPFLDPPAPPARTRRRGDDALVLLLEEAAWDVDDVARRLGVHRATVYRRLKRLAGDTLLAVAGAREPAPREIAAG